MRVNEASVAPSSSSSPIDHDTRRSASCSNDNVTSIRQTPSPFSARLTESPIQHVVSPYRPQREESPLLQALSSSSGTPPPTASSSATTSTPLLTASLNSPPIAHSATSKLISSSDLGSVDLSVHPGSKRSHSQQVNSDSEVRRPQMYTALLMQLRASADSSTAKASSSTTAKKDKTKAQANFHCPVCKKKFHRHIAMNAHFQNEHVGQTQADRVCKLCSHRARDLPGIRAHLLKEHNIDLDAPGACLVEQDNNNNNPNHNSLIDPSAEVISTTGSISMMPQKKQPPPAEIKIEPIEPTSGPTDLRTRSGIPFHDRTGAVTITKSTVVNVKRKRVSLASERPADESWQCQDCAIVFPNQTLYFLHRGFHSDSNPWRCNGCGHDCKDMFDFNTHLISVSHS